MIAVLNWLLAHWYVFFWLAVFGVFEGVRDFFVETFNMITGVRHKRRMKELRLRAQITAPVPASPAVKPGPCVHRRVVPVIAPDETLAAWLCRSCDTQLPPDWAVRQEDL